MKCTFRNAQRGWSLIEIMLAMSLGAGALVILSSLLNASMQASRSSFNSLSLQQQATIALDNLETDLNRAVPGGCTWQDASSGSAALGLHLLNTGTYSGAPTFEPYWTVYVWDTASQCLSRCLFPPSPASVPGAPPTNLCLPPSSSQLLQFSQNPYFNNYRRVGDQVSKFSFSFNPGALAVVQIQFTNPPAQGQQKPEVVTVGRSFYLRNGN